MADSSSAEEPRKLLRYVGKPGDESKPNETAELADSNERSGSNSDNMEVMLPEKREEWYGAKVKRLRGSVEKLRKDLEEKERDNLRLKNKYTVAKQRQVQLQEEVNKQNVVKLDWSSEIEFLRLQLIEKEKELVEHKVESGNEMEENGGETNPEVNCGHDTADSVSSVEGSLSDTFFEKKYLKLNKDTRRKIVYGLFATACVLSLFALGLGSSLLSTIAVGLWTLEVMCVWHERQEILRTMKMKHLKQLRDVVSKNIQLQQDKSKLKTTQNDLELTLSKEVQKNDDIASKFKALNDNLDEEVAKNNQMAKREESMLQELRSERVSRRFAEQRLEEVTAQTQIAREGECGDICKELRDSLGVVNEEKEKLKRENERLIEEIVGMNMKEEKWKMEKEALEERVGNKEEKDSVDNQNDNGMSDNKDLVDDQNGMIDKKAFERKMEEVKKRGKERVETVNGKQSNVYEERKSETQSNASNEKPARCWLCVFKIPKETRVALYVVFLACLMVLLKLVFSSKSSFVVSLLSMMAVGIFNYMVSKENINIS